MEETVRSGLHEISDRILDVADFIGRILEAEHPDAKEILAVHEQVGVLVRDYSALYAKVPEMEKTSVERNQGRRLTDLRRQAGRLPQRSAGQSTSTASDIPTGGGWPFLLQRQPPKSIEPQRGAPSADSRQVHRVGAEIEAWCGACAALREHTVVAAVDGVAKQVICLSCKAKHSYRTEAVRGKAARAEAAAAAPPVEGGKPRKPTGAELEAQRKEAERHAFQKELAEAGDVRTFSPKLTYKTNEIIQHPEHGRGKVENVVRGSILVRFRSGLKSLTTY